MTEKNSTKEEKKKSPEKEEKINLEDEKPAPVLVAPDGGWGWFIVLSYILMGIFSIPIVQTFGLLYKEYFKKIGLSATDISTIINTNSAVSMSTGLVNGPILNRYGFRKVSIGASLISFVGLVLTSRADSFLYFMLSYGIISAFGLGPLMAAHGLAINTYFKKRRSKVTGYAMTGIGMGPIFMPFLVTYLLSTQGVRGTALIQASLSLHSLVGACLLQPVKWHMKKVIPEVEAPLLENNKKEKEDDEDDDPEMEEHLNKHDMEVQSLYGIDTPLPERRRVSISCKGPLLSRNNSQVDGPRAWRSATSINTINLGSSMKIFDDIPINNYQQLNQTEIPENKLNHNSVIPETSPKNKNGCVRILTKIFYFFDLDLLRDPYYLNLLAGMSLAMTGEINFSLLTPFILADFKLYETEIATVMSVIAIVDIVFRFIAPYIGDGLKFSARAMYMIAMVLLIASRMTLIFSSSYISILAVAAFLGVAKGIRTVYMALVIPSYVPLERLASASGIQMVTHGIILLISGPIIGYLRDVTGSYKICILVINFFTFSALVLWSTEIMWQKIKIYYKNKKEKSTTS